MDMLSDEEFDHVRDFDMTESGSDDDTADHDTPSTTPPRIQTPARAHRKIIPCPYDGCSKTFNRNARLQEHIRSHTGERPFRCTHAGCPKAFLRDSHLKHHLTSAHSDIRNYKCSWEGCGKSFATGTRLRRHLQAHEGREKHRCRGYEGCNETFRKHETLRRHILQVHQNKKPFACDRMLVSGLSCDQGFDTAERLRNHQRLMHDTTKFSCTICAAADSNAETYETWHDLQEHIQLFHLASCEFCSQTFNTNKHLAEHLEAAHGVVNSTKPDAKHFPCTSPGCTHVFTKRGNLNVHIKTVHERKKDFVCGSTDVPVPAEVEQPDIQTEGCGRAFTSKASLVEHVRVAHFNLKTKRQQREANKRAKREAENDPSSLSQVKRRKPRKDKGLKKSSALSALSGLQSQTVSGSGLTSFPPFSYGQSAPQTHSSGDVMDDDADDWNQLSGSMTLFGDHLYHNGQGYQLISEDGSTDQARLDDIQYMPCRDPGVVDDTDMEPFFEFEHEHEHIRSNIDPLLRGA